MCMIKLIDVTQNLTYQVNLYLGSYPKYVFFVILFIVWGTNLATNPKPFNILKKACQGCL